MPRIKQKSISKKDKELVGVIRKYIYIRGVNVEDLAIAMRMSEATYYNRLKNPGNFSIEEIRKISKKLDMPTGEILQHI